MAHIVCVLASPRKFGNSTSAALDVLEFFHNAGHTSETLQLCEHVIQACVACGVCDNPPYACPLDGGIVKDTAHELLERIRHADVLLLTSPVYFYGTPALFKALIDRSQRYWAQCQANPDKIKSDKSTAEMMHTKVKPIDKADKSAFVILTAARPTGLKLFDASLLVLRSFMSCIGFTVCDTLCLRDIDEVHSYTSSLPAREQVQHAGVLWASMI